MPPMHKRLPRFMLRRGAQHIAVRFPMPSWMRRAWSGARLFGMSGSRKRAVPFLWRGMAALSDFVTSSRRGTRMPAKWSERLQRFMFFASTGGKEQVGHFAIALWPKRGGEVSRWSRFGFWHRMVARGIFTKRWVSVLTEPRRPRRRQMGASCTRFVSADEWPNTALEPTPAAP